jgi:uncharacterized membrane protein YqjE
MAEKSAPRGVLESLRSLGRHSLELAQNRLELFGIEVEEQKLRFIRLLMLTAAAIFLGNTALLVISATVVILAGEHARLGVLIALCVIYLGGAIWAALALRKELRSAPQAFESSLAELRKDTEWLNPRS